MAMWLMKYGRLLELFTVLVVGLYLILVHTSKSWTSSQSGRLVMSTPEFVQESERLWKKSVESRHNLVEARGGLSRIKAWDYDSFVIWWDYFYPSFSCPHHMERIGKVGDGGKWVCGFSDIFERVSNHHENYNNKNSQSSPSSCIVYSFGVSTDSTFEAEIVSRSNCQVWAYDHSVEKMASSLENDERVHFKKYALHDKVEGMWKTLGEIMRENGHTWIDILKVDIEGAEFRCLNQIMEEFEVLPFGQLLIELHVNRMKFRQFFPWFEKIEAKGLRPVYQEPNNYAAEGLFVEYVFLNIKTSHRVIM